MTYFDLPFQRSSTYSLVNYLNLMDDHRTIVRVIPDRTSVWLPQIKLCKTNAGGARVEAGLETDRGTDVTNDGYRIAK